MKRAYTVIGAILIGLVAASQASADSISFLESSVDPGTLSIPISGVLGFTTSVTASPADGSITVTISNTAWTVTNFDIAVNLLEPVTGAVSDTFKLTGSATLHQVAFAFASDTEGGPPLVPLSGTITITSTETGLPLSFTLGGYAFDPTGASHDLSVTLQSDISDAPTVPEPTTWLLVATGCVGLCGYRWRKRGD